MSKGQAREENEIACLTVKAGVPSNQGPYYDGVEQPEPEKWPELDAVAQTPCIAAWLENEGRGRKKYGRSV